MRDDEPSDEEIQELFDRDADEGISGSGQFLQQEPSEPAPGSDEEESTTLEVSGELEAESDVVLGDEVTIVMDESGFDPQEVTITEGTTVTFVNNGQANHWPASDVHPTHEVLPEFDSERGLATGESYSYTFTEEGTWQCHDHLFARLTCTINVTSSEN